jgi:beta-N-acetylglucosaminidase
MVSKQTAVNMNYYAQVGSKKKGTRCQRFNESDRYQATVLFAKYAAGYDRIGWDNVVLVNGSGSKGYGCMWAAGVLAGRLKTVVFLVNKGHYAQVAACLAKYPYPHIKKVQVVGSGSLIPTATVDAITKGLGFNLVQTRTYDISYNDLLKVQGAQTAVSLDPTAFRFGQPGFYQFAILSDGYSGKVSAAQLDNYIALKSKSGSTLRGMGSAIVSAAKTYRINEVYILAHAAIESGWGGSTLAQGYKYDGKTKVGSGSSAKTYPAGTYYNFFGIGAVDSSPLSGGRSLAIQNGWNTPAKALNGGVKWISTYYIHREASAINGMDPQNTLYKMRFNPAYTAANFATLKDKAMTHQYATASTWATDGANGGIAGVMSAILTSCGKTMATSGLRFSLPVYKG